MNGWIGGNRYLSSGSMQNNAQNVYAICKLYGWEDKPIFAMLGNMQQESTINPQIYENLKQPAKGASYVGWGYGLVQWTPAQKLFNWCYAYNLDYASGNTQLRRIQYEVDSTRNRYAVGSFVQWTGPRATDEEGKIYCPYTFYDFTQDTTHSMSYLVEAFLRWYERPDNIPAKITPRTRYANSWAIFLTGKSSTIIETPGELNDWIIRSEVPKAEKMDMIPLYMYQNRKNYRKKRR